MTSLPGIAGSLFPSRFLTEVLVRESSARAHDRDTVRRMRHFQAWWRGAESCCGPATGLRTLFDLIAMPMFGLLGYRARDAVFSRMNGRAQLETPAAAVVALVLLPWSSRPSLAWREAVQAAWLCGGNWCFILAPPFLTLLDARGHASRRALEIVLPQALDDRAFPYFFSLVNAAAFESRVNEPAPIEALVERAVKFQDRVRDDLQHGVLAALAALGPAVSRHSVNSRVLTTGPAPPSRVDEALTIVYRILFLLFAESRNLVPGHHPIYEGAYTVGLLCREALSPESTPGVWESLAAITRLSRLGVRTDDLIVRPFNGALFARASAPSLEERRSSNRRPATIASRDAALRSALAALGSRPGTGGREEIVYADLGVEQLGAVYERVLDLDPTIAEGAKDGVVRPPSVARHSRRRKESGTFYTPQSLAEFVVRRTLAPLVAGAATDRILSLRVVDPAMGSGAFLVAACRFLASAYEHALVQEGRCAEADLDVETRSDIRRLIAERCLAGVDANPVAVQLARLSLWLTSLARGKPLGFLDHRLRVGNSLIGASPDDLSRLTRRAPVSSLPLFEAAKLEDTLQRLVKPLTTLMARRDDTIEDVRFKEAWWSGMSGEASPLEPWRLACHVWCARWFTEGVTPSPAETRAAIDAALSRQSVTAVTAISRHIAVAREKASAHRFFHWPLEFADVFYDDMGQPKAEAGFDAVIGNPPWEMVRRDPGIAIDAGSASIIRFIRESGLYPSCDRGHVNLYQPFVDRALSIARPGGRIGLVLPWGVASDDGAAALRRRLLDKEGLDTIAGLDNSNGIFPIHRGMRFLVLTVTSGQQTRQIAARFGIRTGAELDELPERDEPGESSFPVRLTPEQLRRIGGTSCRIPDARRACDLALLDRLTREHPALGSSSGWSGRFGRELNATDDREAFGKRGLPILEGKHIQPFAVDIVSPSARIDPLEARRRLPHAPFDRPRLAYRDVSAVGNRTSLIAAVLPAGVVTTHTLFCLKAPLALEEQHFLCGLFNSFVLNAVVRMLMGGHVTTSLVESLPVPVWGGSPDDRRIARLSRQVSERGRPQETQAKLQAAVAQLYRLDGDEFARVLELFPLVPASERALAAKAFADFPPV